MLSSSFPFHLTFFWFVSFHFVPLLFFILLFGWAFVFVIIFSIAGQVERKRSDGRGILATVQHRPIDIQSKVAKKNQIIRKNNIKGIGGQKKKTINRGNRLLLYP